MFKPASTYRIQFHKHFNFSDFEEIIPYLHALGIDTIYASPIFKAVPGSMHGYDSVDPTSINPEIGTEKQLVTIAKRLKQFGMHWIQDIVPNHMAFHTENPWLMDVLKNGIYSPYFNYFDIGLPIATENEPILLPFLGTSLNDALANNELKIALEDSELKLESGGNKWPLNLKAYAIVFNKLPRQEPCLRLWEKWFCKHDNALEKGIPKDFFNDFSESLKNKEFKGAVQDAVNQINNDLTELTQIIDAQFYRLCNWQETDKKINYRRFFTVNALICLNIQHPQVFEWYHAYCIRLIEKGIISGLRIDHIDGLADPTAYLLKLREAVGDDIYIVAEKILHQHEELPINWPIQGNTGYDFLAMVNNLLTNKGAEHAFSKTYEQFTGKKLTVRKEIARKKADILFKHMAGELDNLTQLFIKLGLAKESELRKLPENALREVIGNFLIYCPVYRYYGNSFPLNKTEKKLVEAIFKSIPHEEKHQSALRLVKKALFTLPINDKSYANRAKLFYQRCMQFTGPLTAKGVEDTLMYTYNRFIAHDEVGDSPDFFGLAVADFHKLMKIRQKRWPLSLNGTSTHDTKRGEDVRARLNVLTALPNNWDEWVRIFEKGATALERKSDKFKTLHQNDLYLIYQTLIGIWPMPGEEDKNLAQRVSDYIEKALREAKKRSNWNTPDENYEEIAKHFALNFVDSKNSFVATINNEISDFGIVNSLAQLILKLTCPGIPDFYQGTELWDFSLVDPDNRKAIDYDLRKNNLKELENLDLNELWKERYNGKIKTWITQTGLLHRKYPEIFQ
ncbi:MAG: malto-oligosyltrehalose synthase, partial [Chitinophagaceae bacterium]